LHAFFKELLINEEASATSGWFSYESVPLKWQFPIGLLYDIYSGANDHLQQDDNGQSSKKPTESNSPVDAPTAPRRRTWQLTVHFDDYPSEVLARLDEDGKVMRDAFTNSYKEASFVRYSSTKVVQRLSMEDAMQLWQAVEKRMSSRVDTTN
jgi:autophagy-related protein 5